MNDEIQGKWVRDRQPTDERQYVVKVESRSHHFSFPSIMRWKKEKWQELAGNEYVSAWAEGVDL